MRKRDELNIFPINNNNNYKSIEKLCIDRYIQNYLIRNGLNV